MSDAPVPAGQHAPPAEAAAEAVAKMLGHPTVGQYHRDFARMVLAAAAVAQIGAGLAALPVAHGRGAADEATP